MRIAIHNSYFGKSYAETELSRRIILAAQRLGWDAIEVGNSEEVNAYHPDFVLVLHFRTPKLTSYPTYGCLWHPAAFIKTDQKFIRNILSYDAYLSSSITTDRWLSDRLYNTPKKFFIAPFFTSCNTTNYRDPILQSPRLVYVGTNWDGERFKDLFLELEKQGCSEIYGSQTGWAYLGSSYQGTLPFDGVSVLNTLNRAGVGLCLHRDEHTKDGIPSMRIFEIAASGAISICGDHSFIREQFKDTVLYLDCTLSTTAQVAQIIEYLHWIETHPKLALEMSREAHRIFVERFSLEILLSNLQSHHQNLLRNKGFVHHDGLECTSDLEVSSVQLIVRTGNGELSKLQKTLDSIHQQTYSNLLVLLIKDQSFNSLEQLLERYGDKFPIKILDYEHHAYKSNDLWYGLQSLDAKYFSVLESGAVIYPNHIFTLVKLLDQFENLGIVYSEVIQTLQNASNKRVNLSSEDVLDRATLASMEVTKLSELLPFDHFININSFLARSALVDEFLRQDPNLLLLENLFLLLNLWVRGNSMFSYEATCEINGQLVSFSQADDQLQDEAIQRIHIMMYDRKFPTGKDFNYTKYAQLKKAESDLQQAQQRISAMETSKFWQLRKRWFQFKRQFGLNTNNE